MKKYIKVISVLFALVLAVSGVTVAFALDSKNSSSTSSQYDYTAGDFAKYVVSATPNAINSQSSSVKSYDTTSSQASTSSNASSKNSSTTSSAATSSSANSSSQYAPIPTGIPNQWVWSAENKAWYRFDANNQAIKGWFTENGVKYFLDTITAQMVSDELVQIDKELYHFASNGAMQTGWVWDNQTVSWYIFNEDGKAIKGWYSEDNGNGTIWYYLDTLTAKMHKSEILSINGATYSFDGSGKMQTGWVWNASMSAWLYFENWGGMHTGWLDDENGKSYYLDPLTGKMHTNQFLERDGNTVYATGDGSLAKSSWIWDNPSSSWYYFNADGGMRRGWLDDGVTRYFLSTTDGKMVRGWADIDYYRYYFGSDGAMKIGVFEADGKTYVTDAEGHVIGEYTDELQGIDVSTWQGDIDWQAVKNSGVDFVMIRSNFGWTGVDNKFEQNYEGAKAVGLKVGVYSYSYATNTDEAYQEAQNVLSTLNGRQLDYPVAYDLEDPNAQSSLSVEELTDIACTFCNTVSNAGYKPMIYASLSWMENKLYYPSIQNYGLWVAQWGSSHCQFEYRNPDIWQYTSDGIVDGIDGRVDMDIGYTPY